MKPRFRFSTAGMVMAAALGTLLFQCSTDSRRSGGQSFELERKELERELTELRNDIDGDLERTGTRVQVTSEEAKERLESANRALSREKINVEKALESVNNATEDSWRRVRKNARFTLDETKRMYFKLQKNLKNVVAKR